MKRQYAIQGRSGLWWNGHTQPQWVCEKNREIFYRNMLPERIAIMSGGVRRLVLRGDRTGYEEDGLLHALVSKLAEVE